VLGVDEHLFCLAARQAVVEQGRRNAPGLQVGHLVVHERHEGCDHERKARRDECRYLVEERLTFPGGKHRQHVPAFQHGPEGGDLLRAEGDVPPHPLQHPLGLGKLVGSAGDGVHHAVNFRLM
jgi:hypothetical protein